MNRKKSRRSAKGHTPRKNYKNEGRRAKHKEDRQAKHLLKIELEKERKGKRLELQEEVMKKLRINSFQLKKLIGTPNIRRLTDVVEDRYLDANWYLERQKKKEQKEKDAQDKLNTNKIKKNH